MFVKKKTSESTLAHVVVETRGAIVTDAIAEEIKKRLGWIKTPMLLEEFKRKFARRSPPILQSA
jgi:hypothetical protein